MNGAHPSAPLVRFSEVPCGDHFQKSNHILLKQSDGEAENIETGEIVTISPDTMVHHTPPPVPEIITAADQEPA